MVPLRLLLGIFLTSAATLTLQIAIIRLLSVAQWHHFAFMVVSLALLGYGASGSFLSSFPSILRRDLPPFLSGSSWLFSATGLAAYLLSHQIPFDVARIAWDRWQILYLFLFYLVFSVPFFFSGLTLSAALTRLSAQSGRIYFSDLTGAASGCLLVLGFFTLFGGVGTLMAACILGGMASIAFEGKNRKFSVLRWTWLLLLVFFLSWNPPFLELPISPYKELNVALRFPGAHLLETRWSASSRIDLVESSAARTAPGLSLEYLHPLPPQIGLTIDGSRMSPITRFRGDPKTTEDLSFLDFLPSSLPYKIIQPERVLILEPKGGLEVLNALRHRAKEIVAVETDPMIVDLLKGPYRDQSGGIYLRKETRVYVQEGRSFVRGVESRFDLIVLPLEESLGASTTGFSGLREEYELTTEALRDYLRALRPGGFLFLNVYLLPPPRAELRLISMGKEALRKTGQDLRGHLLAFRSWGTFSLLLKKNPVLPEEIRILKSICRKLRFDLVAYPGIREEEANIFNRFPKPIYFNGVERLLHDGREFIATYPFDLTPPTDNRPFFHDYFRWGYFAEIYRLAGAKWQILLEGGFLVPVVFFLALIASLMFMVAPLCFRKRGAGGASRNHSIFWLFYFILLGLGFMFVEISLIQKFILFLGHPVYAVSMIIFSLLVFAGLGSRISMKIAMISSINLQRVLLLNTLFLLLFAFFLFPALTFFQNQAFPLRLLLTVLFIAPLGVTMGMPFPLGIRWVGKTQWPLIPWAWCANGCASVIGAILPVILALYGGFQMVIVLASFLYAMAFWTIRKIT